MKSQTGRRRWVAGALRAGRAAAFLTLATGINGTISALEPRYEPIYVYLAAIVIVAWLGSLLLGVTTAVAAVILYDAMFSPIDRSASWAAALPFLVAIGAAVVTRMARVPVERSRATFAAATPPPLLETSAPKVVRVVPAVDEQELEELREQLGDAGRRLDQARAELDTARRERDQARSDLSHTRTALDELRAAAEQTQRSLDEARTAVERETRVRIEQGATAKARLTGLQHELDSARSDAIEQAKRAAALQAQLDDITRRGQGDTDRAASFEPELQAARAKSRELETRLEETVQELELAWRRVDEEKARSDKEAGRLNQLERRANEALQRATREMAAQYQEPLSEAKKRLEEAFTRIPVLESERDAARLAAGETAARVTALEDEANRLRKELEDARSKVEMERAERQRVEKDFDRKIATIAEGLTHDYEASLGDALVEKESARAEVRDLTARLQRAEKKLAETSADLEDARSKIEIERAERQRVEADFDRKIATIAEGLTHDYEASLGEAIVEKESARAEVRDLTSRLKNAEKKVNEVNTQLEDARKSLEREREQLERTAADFDSRIASIADGLTRDYEDSLGQAMIDKEAARAEVRALTAKVEKLQTKIDLERAQRESLEADLMPAARAEIAALTSTIESLQKQLEAAQAERDRVERQMEEVRSRAELERSAHERALADFDRKIASIVAGITTDHEQAIGEAMVEKEGARAEVRALNKKVEALQQRLNAEQARADEEKAARERLDAEWSTKLQTIVNHLASDHEADLGEAMLQKEAAKAEVRVLTSRVKALEQKIEAERRRSVEMPLPNRAAVLIVHSDAGMRAMSKHALEQDGYTVMTAADGLEGLRIASSHRPDVVLAEAVMPKMNGRELLQLLKARSETAAIKVVLMNGGAADRGSDFRADDVLATPGDFAAMKATLEAVLAK